MSTRKTDFRRDAKVLCYDLEVSPNLGWFYGQYETTAIKIEQPPVLLALSWKWLGDKGKPQCVCIGDFKQSDKYDDTGIVNKLWSLLDECNVSVGHNSMGFDDKMSNAFFVRHGLTPPSPYKQFDTLRTARRFFKFDNNKLGYLGELFFGEGKTEVTYGGCWDKMLHGDKKEKKKYTELMRKYCTNDVELLVKLYNKLLPWATNHPNMALMAEVDFVCPRCGNDSDFTPKSYRRTGVQVNAIQYRCKRCSGYVTRVLTKEEREELDAQGKLKAKYRNTTP